MKRKEQYKHNKSAKVGETIVCPICGKHFVKKQWQQAFCCDNCKNKYWNAKGDRHRDKNYYSNYNQKHPERYERLIGLGTTRAEREYNTALYHLATDKDFKEWVNETALNADGSWDEHNAPSDLADLWEQYEQEGIDIY